MSEPSLHADTDPRILNVLRALRAERVDRDELLDAFMGFAVGLPSVQFGLWVQLLVDGRLVRGRTMSEEHSASRLDQDVAAGFRTFEETATESEQQLAEVALGWMDSGHFAAPAAERTKRRQDLFDRIETEEDFQRVEKSEFEWIELPTRKAADYIEASLRPTALHLSECHMLIDGRWEHLGEFRIPIRSISGWWLFTAGEDEADVE